MQSTVKICITINVSDQTGYGISWTGQNDCTNAVSRENEPAPLQKIEQCQMNIFFLSLNTRRCARWHCDKHVVKMILETCQLLYTCHWMLSNDAEPPYLHCAPSRGYKPTHANHPCNIWLRESLDNYRWLVRLGNDLIKEYKFRYNNRTHKCEEHLMWLSIVEPALQSKGFTQPPQAMPPQYKHSDSTIAYRQYYKFDKDIEKGIVKYTKRHRPHFLRVT
jgi:hypothetical protein